MGLWVYDALCLTPPRPRGRPKNAPFGPRGRGVRTTFHIFFANSHTDRSDVYEFNINRVRNNP